MVRGPPTDGLWGHNERPETGNKKADVTAKVQHLRFVLTIFGTI